MSVKKAKDFLVHLATDEAAASRSQAAHEASLLKVAAELGYTFSAADLREAMAEVSALDELSEDDLERVVGGLRSTSFAGRSSFRGFSRTLRPDSSIG